MKIVSVSSSASKGGAARAAYRLHEAMLRQSIDSEMWVGSGDVNGEQVSGPHGTIERFIAKLRPELSKPIVKMLGTNNEVLHSPSIIPSRLPTKLNRSGASIVHLHWVQNEMLSIADVGKLMMPLVWTFHDMWPFCGAEHYSTDERWKSGYSLENRPAEESGLDLNKWCWERKMRHWKHPAHVVTPSHWLAECVRSSRLMRDWPVTVIPNCINTDFWRPRGKEEARTTLGLPLETPLLLFGADGGAADKRKGFDLLLGALIGLRSKLPDLELVVFGAKGNDKESDLGFPIHYSGEVTNDDHLRTIYGACDLMVIPSRQDNLPNTALESLACGTPVVAFDIGGMPDIVAHRVNGCLARPFDIDDLARQIDWVVRESTFKTLSEAARETAVTKFSEQVVICQHVALYNEVLSC